MKCIQLQNQFGIQNLQMVERPKPSPNPYQILVRNTYTSINYRDLLMIEGKYNPRQKLPLIPFSDGAGVIEEVGEKVTQWKVGDRVIACFAPHWHDGDPEIDFIRSTIGGPEDGNLSEYSVFHESGVVKTPDFLSDAEAATIPCAGLTAYNALVYLGNLKPGNTVVILGTGGVSLFALQIAKMMGCQVIITSRSEEKLKKALLLGADQGILTSQKANWDREIRKLTSMKGADFVLEVGGAGTLPKSIQSVRPGGVVALIGVLAGGESKDLSLYPVLMQGIRIQGVIVGNTSMLRSFCHALESNKIKPVLDEEFSWTKTKEALEYLSLGKHFGKIPIKID